MALKLVDTYRVLDREPNLLTARAIIAEMEQVGREPFLYRGQPARPQNVHELEVMRELEDQAQWLREWEHAHALKPGPNVSHRKRSWWPLVALGVIVVGIAIVLWGGR